MKRCFLGDGDRDALDRLRRKERQVLAVGELDVLAKGGGNGDRRIGVVRGEIQQGVRERCFDRGVEHDRDRRDALGAGRDARVYTLGQSGELEHQRAVEVDALDRAEKHPATAAGNARALSFARRFQLQYGLWRRDLDAVDVQGAARAEVVIDLDRVVAVRGNPEAQAAIGTGALVVVLRDPVARAVEDEEPCIERRAQRPRAHDEIEALAGMRGEEPQIAIEGMFQATVEDRGRRERRGFGEGIVRLVLEGAGKVGDVEEERRGCDPALARRAPREGAARDPAQGCSARSSGQIALEGALAARIAEQCEARVLSATRTQRIGDERPREATGVEQVMRAGTAPIRALAHAQEVAAVRGQDCRDGRILAREGGIVAACELETALVQECQVRVEQLAAQAQRLDLGRDLLSGTTIEGVPVGVLVLRHAAHGYVELDRLRALARIVVFDLVDALERADREGLQPAQARARADAHGVEPERRVGRDRDARVHEVVALDTQLAQFEPGRIEHEVDCVGKARAGDVERDLAASRAAAGQDLREGGRAGERDVRESEEQEEAPDRLKAVLRSRSGLEYRLQAVWKGRRTVAPPQARISSSKRPPFTRRIGRFPPARST